MLAHTSLVFVHILLFCLWLGMDIGVYYCGKYTTRADLTVKERRRFLELLLILDMGPRTALVLMIPVGTQLGFNLGLIPIGTVALASLWIVTLFWLSLVWIQFLYPSHPARTRMAQIDYAFRYLAIAVFVGIGLFSIFGGLAGGPDSGLGGSNWLQLKFVFYGAVISIGLILRSTLPPWLGALKTLEETDGARGQAEIEAVYSIAGRWAQALWGLVLAMAYLGTTKIL